MELCIFQKGFNFAQDGPGNRLVYHLQGCNLHCPWCSNPEGLTAQGGTAYPVDVLAQEARSSRLLYFEGGGVTLTGGEATLQFDAVAAFLRRLHADGIHTCMETNGTSPRLPELFAHLDLLILDVKHHDPAQHAAVTGGSGRMVLYSLQAALAAGQPLALRIPLIGGFNASPEDAEAFVRLFLRLGVPGRASVELLPYHDYGRSKYESLHLPYSMGESAKISAQTLRQWEDRFTQAGIALVHT